LNLIKFIPIYGGQRVGFIGSQLTNITHCSAEFATVFSSIEKVATVKCEYHCNFPVPTQDEEAELASGAF